MERNVQLVAVGEYLTDHLAQLKLLARDNGLDVLAYLIEIAEIQAHDNTIEMKSSFLEKS